MLAVFSYGMGSSNEHGCGSGCARHTDDACFEHEEKFKFAAGVEGLNVNL